MILAIDTSTHQAGLALVSNGTVRAELSWTAAGNHSRDLSSMIETLLALEGCPPEALSALIVASGPGSFSGLRVGISEGKGLAMALGVPLVGISTLDAIALQAISLSQRVWAVLPAGRRQVYASAYEGTWDTMRRVGDYMILSVERAAQLATGMLIGDAAAEVAAVSADQDLQTVPGPWQLRRAGFLAELGKRYLEAGGQDQRDVLEPLYLRRSAAEEKRLGSSR